MSWKALGLAGVAAATIVTSTAVMTDSAEARWRGGWGGGGYGGGYGYRGGFGGYRGYGYRRGWGGGGAVAAGLIGGLALGALASRPAYGYGGYYGGGYAPAYYGGGYPAYGYGYAPAYYGGGCTWRARRVWGPYGPYVVRQRVCY